jgi:hypothetical protein
MGVKLVTIPDTYPLQIGDFVFEKVIAKSDVIERDSFKDNTKTKYIPIKVVAWLLDNWQFGNPMWTFTKKSALEKKADLVAMVESKAIFEVTDNDLNASNVRFCEILRVSFEYPKGYIVVSLDLEQRHSQQDKQDNREPVKLVDADTPEATEKATAEKKNQATEAQAESNKLLDWAEGKLRGLWK